jgi:hypothetical protein
MVLNVLAPIVLGCTAIGEEAFRAEGVAAVCEEPRPTRGIVRDIDRRDVDL